jgi:tetratricopeptide (TPR) repeat protein
MADRTLRLIMTRCKQGHSLNQISELTELTVGEVKEALGQATGLTPREVSIIFRMKQEGCSLEQISQEYGVELEVLKQFLPEETTPVIKETAVGLETQIEELFRQGRRPPEIGQMLGISERAVLAYALESINTETPERVPIDSRPHSEQARQDARQEEQAEHRKQARQEEQARFKEQASECRAQGESQLAELFDQAASQLITTEQLATIYNGLGRLYKRKGDIRRAEEYNLKCLRIRQEVFPANHPDLATIYNDLGSLYESKGNKSRAEKFYLECLSIRQEVLPANHPKLALIYNNLGSLYYNKGDSRKAEKLYLKGLSIWQEVLPANHPDLATIYYNLANLYYCKGDRRRTEEFYLKCLSIRQEVLPDNHPDLATIYNDLGSLYFR